LSGNSGYGSSPNKIVGIGVSSNVVEHSHGINSPEFSCAIIIPGVMVKKRTKKSINACCR